MTRFNRLTLRTRIVVVLVLIVTPAFLLVSFFERKMTEPALEDEIRQSGIAIASSLATEIQEERIIDKPEFARKLARHLREINYRESSLVRIDILVKNPEGGLRTWVSSAEGLEWDLSPRATLEPKMVSNRTTTVAGAPVWEIVAPIRASPRGAIAGNVRLLMSVKIVEKLIAQLWRNNAFAGGVTIVLLIIVFNFFLQRLFENEKLLQLSEKKNLQLTTHVQDLEQKIDENEKLAVMGQLTASVAHEVGSPLTALSAHLQLLSSEVATSLELGKTNRDKWLARLDTINKQIVKIETIIKSFLHSTTKPSEQSRLVDINQIVKETVAIVQPKLTNLGIEVTRDLKSGLPLLRLAPLEMEQILLNLLNNATDGVQKKVTEGGNGLKNIRISTAVEELSGSVKVVISDTGAGISQDNLRRVFKPFFTTKAEGKGTGLGLSICKELAERNGGSIDIDSKDGEWTVAVVRIPYEGA